MKGGLSAALLLYLAAAVIAAAVVGEVAAAIAATVVAIAVVAAAAEEQNQNDDPPATVITIGHTHNQLPPRNFSERFAAHSMVFREAKKVHPRMRNHFCQFPFIGQVR